MRTEDLKSFLKHPWGEDWWLFYLNKYECDLFSFSVFRTRHQRLWTLMWFVFHMRNLMWEKLIEKELNCTWNLLHFQIQKFLPDSLSKYTHYVNHWMKAYVYPYFTNTNLSHSISTLSENNKKSTVIYWQFVIKHIKYILMNHKIMFCYCYSTIFLMTCKIRTSYLSILWA